MESPTLEDKSGSSDSGPRWIKSSLSFANGNCVEVANLPERVVGVRDSKNSDGAILRFSPDQWRAFMADVRHRR